MTSASHPRRELIDLIKLARTASVGPGTFVHLMARFGSATRALQELPRLARRGGRALPLEIASDDQANAELEAGIAIGAHLLTSGTREFPVLLSVLDPPPPLIWTLGDPGLLAQRTIAIVGARSASTAGQRFAFDLAADLGAAGYRVVSGLARGIDAAAHKGSLTTGTVAVLAGGVDSIYPPEHAELYDQIVNHGCVVSERPMGFTARAADFPRRNRLISGLALGVVVVEAELRSGSLITARLAGEQGREVFAVPGSPIDPRSRGANDLIRQGATLVEDADDVLRVLDPTPDLRAPEPPPWRNDLTWKDDDTLTQRIADLLSPAPATTDHIARSCGAPISQVLAALTELALAGRAEMLSGSLAVSREEGSR